MPSVSRKGGKKNLPENAGFVVIAAGPDEYVEMAKGLLAPSNGQACWRLML